jgi:hypothetical protein
MSWRQFLEQNLFRFWVQSLINAPFSRDGRLRAIVSLRSVPLDYRWIMPLPVHSLYSLPNPTVGCLTVY